MAQSVKIPAVGESITEVTIANWLKKNGDAVAMDEVIAELETDKATFELRAPQAGTLKIIKQKGETIPIGTIVCEVADAAGVPASAPAPAKAPEKLADSKPTPTGKVKEMKVPAV